MQQDQNYESEEDEKVAAVGVACGRPIAALGIATDGPIDLGSDSNDDKNISIDSVPKMKWLPNVAWLQELEEINQSIYANNTELRRLLHEVEK